MVDQAHIDLALAGRLDNRCVVWIDLHIIGDHACKPCTCRLFADIDADGRHKGLEAAIGRRPAYPAAPLLVGQIEDARRQFVARDFSVL